MFLEEALAALETFTLYGNPPAEISRIVVDSRQVTKGACFVAIPGVNVDGHRFIPQAIERGAVLIVGEREPAPSWLEKAAYIRVPNSRQALAHLAAAYYGHPSEKLLIVGITGTDGKTTTAHLVERVLARAGWTTGMVSTIGARIGREELDTGFHVTTPDALDLQRYLAMMVQRGIQAVVLEVTSHGLAQHRVDGVAFDAAIITNVTHEHLDYHGTWEEYMAAKARLFRLTEQAPPKGDLPKVGVLNRDDRSFHHLHPLPMREVTYGLTRDADIYPLHVESRAEGTVLEVHTPRGNLTLHSSLLGTFNVYNILAAVGLGIGWDLPLPAIQAGIREVERIPGRLEFIDEGQDFWAVVDFAHSPNALKHALITLRALTSGRLIAVFGSAGLRDVDKRYLMGEVGARLADVVLLTAEDPRTESLEHILAEMARGARDGGGVEGTTFWRVPDRQEAILRAVMLAQPGDVVAVFGKGHERSMCFGHEEYPWQDREALRWALKVRQRGAAQAGRPPFQLPTWPNSHKSIPDPST